MIILLDSRYFKEKDISKIQEAFAPCIVIICDFPSTDHSMIKIIKS